MSRPVVQRAAIAAGIALVAAIVLLPLRTRTLRPRTRPMRAYADAVQRVAAMRAFEQPVVTKYGGTILLSRGVRAPRIAVLLHGLTATPHQFEALGAQLFARGYDVFIPRIPMHGERGRDVTALSGLTADTLRAFADDVIDIARGLGDSIDVLGLSGGGTIAAWIAQHRAGVRRVVIVAPAIAFSHMPRALEDPAMQLLARIPNVNVGAAADSGKPEVYAGFSTRAVAQTMRLGAEVRDDAARTAPATRTITLVTNANDRTIDGGAALALGDRWTQHGASVIRFQFPAALGLPHDVVDGAERCGNVALVYPILIALIEGRAPAPTLAAHAARRDCLNR